LNNNNDTVVMVFTYLYVIYYENLQQKSSYQRIYLGYTTRDNYIPDIPYQG
jgi:hypothetical protein